MSKLTTKERIQLTWWIISGLVVMGLMGYVEDASWL